MQSNWIKTLLPTHLQLESYQGQLTLELEQIVHKYPNLPEWVWKNALKDALSNLTSTHHVKSKPRSQKWPCYVKENYDAVKTEMGKDARRVDVLTRLSDMYQKSKSSSSSGKASSILKYS